jgi:adenylate cyclase
MASEVERKFLIERPPPWLGEHEGVEIEQGYLAIDAEAEVRIRRADGSCTLTVKRGEGESREEYEVPLEPAQIEPLWEACGERRLRKHRHTVPLDGGLRAEVDVYRDRLQGLAVVEVEFPDEERADGFEPPAWFGRELTGEHRYANQALAVDGAPPDV